LIIAANEAELRAQFDFDCINQAQLFTEEMISGLAESVEGCFDAADASMTRLEATLDEMLRTLPAQDSSGWTN
jgi:hypothetical protein